MENILKINGLSKKYGSFKALDNINLEVHEKDIYGLIGQNGAGKTTLLKIIMGLSQQSEGNISILNSKNGNEILKNRKRIGFYIGQSFFPYLNAKENIEYYRKLKGIKARNETNRVLKIVGLDGVKKPFRDYSMGMKQRLGIASAMLGNPEIIILDEPINGLDPQGIVDIRNIIKLLNEKYNTTLIVSSHILNELDLVANRFGIIDHGKLVKEISYDELHDKTSSSIMLKVDDINKTMNILGDKFNLENIKAIDENYIEINEVFNETNLINKTLIENNIEVFEICKEESTLEDYYFSLIGGGKND